MTSPYTVTLLVRRDGSALHHFVDFRVTEPTERTAVQAAQAEAQRAGWQVNAQLPYLLRRPRPRKGA